MNADFGWRFTRINVERLGVSETAYLMIMVSIIIVVALVSVPGLFRKRCPKCGAWNGLEANNCSHCPHIFPEDVP